MTKSELKKKEETLHVKEEELEASIERYKNLSFDAELERRKAEIAAKRIKTESVNTVNTPVRLAGRNAKFSNPITTGRDKKSGRPIDYYSDDYYTEIRKGVRGQGSKNIVRFFSAPERKGKFFSVAEVIAVIGNERGTALRYFFNAGTLSEKIDEKGVVRYSAIYSTDK